MDTLDSTAVALLEPKTTRGQEQIKIAYERIINNHCHCIN